MTKELNDALLEEVHLNEAKIEALEKKNRLPGEKVKELYDKLLDDNQKNLKTI